MQWMNEHIGVSFDHFLSSVDSHHQPHQAFKWSILLNAGLSGLQIVIGISYG